LLRFTLHQLHVPSLGRYLLPLPKLSQPQLAALSSHLEARGFYVSQSGGGKRVAKKGGQRISIDGALGLATSGEDMLDALAPAVPSLLESRPPPAGVTGRADLYFSVKRSGDSTELQLFPRMESLRTWTCLRRDGLCGLTPDEAAVLRRLLGRAPRSFRVECVTSRPRQGSKVLQVGRMIYYRSSLPAAEFLASLGTVDSARIDSASYLPRDSIIALPGAIEAHIAPKDLGEWCFIA
jgi:hypothetical protein